MEWDDRSFCYLFFSFFFYSFFVVVYFSLSIQVTWLIKPLCRWYLYHHWAADTQYLLIPQSNFTSVSSSWFLTVIILCQYIWTSGWMQQYIWTKYLNIISFLHKYLQTKTSFYNEQCVIITLTYWNNKSKLLGTFELSK